MSSPLLKNFLPLQSLLSLDLSSKSLMSGALSKNLLRSFFLPVSTSRIKEPITGFCASKCFTSLNKSSIGFWFFIMFSRWGRAYVPKAGLVQASISLPNLLVAKRYFLTSSLGVLFASCCWKSVSCEKSILSSQSL